MSAKCQKQTLKAWQEIAPDSHLETGIASWGQASLARPQWGSTLRPGWPARRFLSEAVRAVLCERADRPGKSAHRGVTYAPSLDDLGRPG